MGDVPVGTTDAVGGAEVPPGKKGVSVGPAGVGAKLQPSTISIIATTKRIRCLDLILPTSLDDYITQQIPRKKTRYQLPSSQQILRHGAVADSRQKGATVDQPTPTKVQDQNSHKATMAHEDNTLPIRML